MPRYTPPELEGHKVAYRGRRFWIIEVDEQHPFDWVEAVFGEYTIWDAADVATAGYAKKDPRGGFLCTFQYGLHELECRAESLQAIGPVVNAASLKAWRD
jgi:hypothetical protein